MSYIRMYRDDYVKENELEHRYLNHTEKFVTYMEEQGLGDRIFDIGPDQLRQSVAEYSKRGSIKTINTKPVTSPDTGDNTNIWMWFAVLFVSGMGLFGTIVYDRKKKQAK